MSAEYPSLEWFRDTENWQRWSSLIAMKFGHLAADRVLRGTSVANAVNEQICETVEDLNREMVPPTIVAEFARQYLENRPSLMKNAAEMVELLSTPLPKRRKRKE